MSSPYRSPGQGPGCGVVSVRVPGLTPSRQMVRSQSRGWQAESWEDLVFPFRLEGGKGQGPALGQQAEVPALTEGRRLVPCGLTIGWARAVHVSADRSS